MDFDDIKIGHLYKIKPLNRFFFLYENDVGMLYGNDRSYNPITNNILRRFLGPDIPFMVVEKHKLTGKHSNHKIYCKILYKDKIYWSKMILSHIEPVKDA